MQFWQKLFELVPLRNTKHLRMTRLQSTSKITMNLITATKDVLKKKSESIAWPMIRPRLSAPGQELLFNYFTLITYYDDPSMCKPHRSASPVYSLSKQYLATEIFQ